jgi:hypothetical protein
MKFSMWMLLDELAEFNPKSAIRDGAQTIDGARLYSSEKTVQDNYVRIGNSHDFNKDNSNHVLLAHGRDTITIENAAVAEILNAVIHTFEKYRDWDEKLRHARHEANPFQATLDIAHELFGCPMFFGQKNLRIYAITRQYTKERVYEEWDEVKASNTMPTRLLERLKCYDIPSRYPDAVDPAVIPARGDDAEKFCFTIRTNCYFNGQLWGHLYLYYNKPSVSQTVLQLTRYVADLYTALLNQSQNKDAGKYAQYTYIVDLLTGKPVPDDAIDNLYWTLNWAKSDTLTVYRIDTATTVYGTMLLEWICDSIIARSPNDIVFPYKNSVVIISRRTKTQPKILLSDIIQLITTGDCHCGVSFSFEDLNNIAAHYEQAGYAIDFAADPVKRVHFFSDCMFSGLSKALWARVSWRDWVLPSLLDLANTDASQGTAYYKTLYCFLIHKGHLGNTSKELFIHRNTLTNRLDKIVQLLGADIYEESVSAYLRFCYAVMADAYPVA